MTEQPKTPALQDLDLRALGDVCGGFDELPPNDLLPPGMPVPPSPVPLPWPWHYLTLDL